MSRILETVMGTSRIETFYATVCIFFGQSEAILMIQPYLDKLSDSELFTVMTVGFSCVSGALLPIYVSFGVSYCISLKKHYSVVTVTVMF